MQGWHRTLFRLLVLGLFAVTTFFLFASPTRYKVDLDALVTIWGDVFRDLDSVVRTVRISTDLEIDFGNAIAGDYWTEGGETADQAYVAFVGAKVAEQARRQDLPWTFHVVDTGYRNAWAILGGHVYITTGMLDLIESEAELAALLGHEIAHVDLFHCVDLVQNRMILERVGLGAIGFVLGLAEDFLRVGYSEVEEDEADRYGMLLASKAGYSPLHAFDTFHKFYLEEEAASTPQRPAGGPEAEILSSLSEFLQDYFDTHPAFADRLDALRALLDANARAWEGRAFRVGKAAYAARDISAGKAADPDSWVFSENDADYLALRAELAYLLGRENEASRYFDRLLEGFPNDTRIDALKALLSGAADPIPTPDVSAPTIPNPAAQIHEENCKEGDAQACTTLGEFYEDGLGVAQDYQRAAQLYEQGCDGGDAGGCTNLGYLYEDGLGVAQDYQRAAQLYEQGCDGGHARGCTNLGYLYRKGLGVEQDEQRAAQLYEQGCDGGHARGCSTLAFLYTEGEGVERNLDIAVKFAKRACDADNASGCNNLAWALYLSGRNWQAVGAVDRSLELRPDYVAAIDTKAHVLTALDLRRTALATFERAMELGGADQVRVYQEALAGHGYDIGEPNGVYDDATRAALFQCLEAGCRLIE